MPMCASDIITMYNITKQNMNIMALTLSAYYNMWSAGETKTKRLGKSVT